MRCFCCNTHKNTHYDTLSRRFYCEECFSVSMESLRELEEEYEDDDKADTEES